MDRTQRRDKRAIAVYATVAAFCGVFAFVYAQFSHGVSSAAMTFMFLYPLIGGAGMYALMLVLPLRSFGRLSFNAYNSGIATLTVGSLLAGVFEIAGTSSAYQPVFTVVGVALIATAFVLWFIEAHRSSERACPRTAAGQRGRPALRARRR